MHGRHPPPAPGTRGPSEGILAGAAPGSRGSSWRGDSSTGEVVVIPEPPGIPGKASSASRRSQRQRGEEGSGAGRIRIVSRCSRMCPRPRWEAPSRRDRFGDPRVTPRAPRVSEQEGEQGRLKALSPNSLNPADVSHPCSSWGGGRFKGRFEFKNWDLFQEERLLLAEPPFLFRQKPQKSSPRTAGPRSSFAAPAGGWGPPPQYKPFPVQTVPSTNHSQYKPFPAQIIPSINHSQHKPFPV